LTPGAVTVAVAVWAAQQVRSEIPDRACPRAEHKHGLSGENRQTQVLGRIPTLQGPASDGKGVHEDEAGIRLPVVSSGRKRTGTNLGWCVERVFPEP
jgi:hypothetical protein